MSPLSRYAVWLSALVTLAMAAGACGSGSSPSASAPSSSKHPATRPSDSPYAVRILATNGRSTTQINVVPPTPGRSPTRSGLGANRAARFGHDAHPLDLLPAVPAAPGSQSLLDFSTPAPDAGALPVVDATPIDLLHAAAAECGLIGDEFLTIARDPASQADPFLQDIITEENNGQRIPQRSFVYPWTETPLNQQQNGPPRVNFDQSYYYIWNVAPDTCDAVLEYEENLVCIADKLSQLVDAVGPLTWHAERFTVLNPTFIPPSQDADAGAATQPALAWIIPPLAQKDKFIVRDLAIDVLSHVPMLDSFMMPATDATPGGTCSQLFATYASQPDASALQGVLFGNALNLFNSPEYPPTHGLTGAALAAERQAFEGQVLRGAGQLLHDLVRASVYADLSGAAPNLSPVCNPNGGQTALDVDGGAPYDSVGHIARTLFGRWEQTDPLPGNCPGDPDCFANGDEPGVSSPGEPDPQCNGVAELELMSVADPGITAKAKAVMPTTPGQARAATLFEETGLVVLDHPDASFDLRQTLTNEVIAVKAARAGVSPSDYQGTQGVQNLIASLTDSDLAVGAQHNRLTFSIAADASTNTDVGTLATAASHAGLTPDMTFSSPSAIVISGGLPASDMTSDPMARVGSMMVESQCAEAEGSGSNAGFSSPGQLALLGDESTQAAPGVLTNQFDCSDSCPMGVLQPTDHNYRPEAFSTYARQDVFAVGQAIRSRLVKLRELADGSNAVGPTTSAAAQARAAAVSELGAWAGSGRIIYYADVSDTGAQAPPVAPTQMNLWFRGVQPADFGVQQLGDLQSAIELVYGDAALAECAANLRPIAQCPTALVSAAVWNSGGTQTPDPGTSLDRSQDGTTGQDVVVTFPAGSMPSNLAVFSNTPPFFGFDKPFYVVATQDPTQAPGVGMILGTVRLPTYAQPAGSDAVAWSEGAITLSPMRRELVKAAFGLGQWVGAPPRVGDLPVSGLPQSCIEGVPEDIFVPLQNDLTDNSSSYENSWQHYLSLAQQAATNADSLAQDLLQTELEEAQNVDNATQQAQNFVAAPLNSQCVSIDTNGNVDAGACNPAFQEVLAQPTLDVVFYGADPAPGFAGVSPDGGVPSGAISALSNALNCGPGQTGVGTALCNKLTGAIAGGTVVDVPPGNLGTVTRTPPTQFTYTALGKAVRSVDPPCPSTDPLCGCTALVNDALNARQINPSTHAKAANSSLLGATFQSDLQTATDGILDFSKVHMTVDDSTTVGHWNVSVGGVTLMDSDAPPSWPACLGADGNGVTCDWSNPVISALNDMFRLCPSQTDLRSPTLGACETATLTVPGGAAISNTGTMDQELNAIRWRVEGALWLGAMISGEVPQGMFNVPVPAVNFPSGAQDVNYAPAITYYGTGSFVVGPGTLVQGFATNSAVDSSSDSLAQWNPVATRPSSDRYFQWGPVGGQQLPYWLGLIYSPAEARAWAARHFSSSTPLKDHLFVPGEPNSGDAPQAASVSTWIHAFGSNPDGESDFTPLNAYFRNVLGFGGLQPPPDPKSGAGTPGQNRLPLHFLGAYAAARYPSASCGDPRDTAQLTTTSALPDDLGFVAALKSELSDGSDMQTAYQSGANSFGFYTAQYGPVFAANHPAVFRQTRNPFVECGASDATNPSGLATADYENNPLLLPPAFYHLEIDDCGNLDQDSTATQNPIADSEYWTPDPWALRRGVENTVTPDQRVQFFVNSGPPVSSCDALWQVTQAPALACIVSRSTRALPAPAVGTPPPEVTNLDSLNRLSDWVHAQTAHVQDLLAASYVPNVPVAVVTAALGVPNALNGQSGQIGTSITQEATQLTDLFDKSNDIQYDAQLLGLALDQVRESVQQATITNQIANVNEEIAHLSTERELATDIGDIVSGVGQIVGGFAGFSTGGAGAMPSVGLPVLSAISGILEGGSTIGTAIARITDDDQILTKEGELVTLNNQNLQLAVQGALTNLNVSVTTEGRTMTDDVSSLQKDVSSLTSGAATIAGDKFQTLYWLGVASGADVWNCGGSSDNQVECESHVNTVLNRRYSSTLLRYHEALRQAKYAAYLARLSVEQRIGIRLSDICQPIGTLDPPSTWADDVCHTTGLSLPALQAAISPSAGTPDQVAASESILAREQADAFIGDYVQKLTNFVNFYNVAYPEQDGNSTAVLSLRESLLGGQSSCQGPSINLLVDSSRLYDVASPGEAGVPNGWVRQACQSGAATCLQVRPSTLAPPSTPGGATWLTDVAPSSTGPGANAGTVTGGPPDVLEQSVNIANPGTYVLSWWDQAVDATGQATSVQQPAYTVTIYNSAGAGQTQVGVVKSQTYTPSNGSWSARRSLSFPTPPDVLYVAFQASVPGGAASSVAIANVQLEQVSSSMSGQGAPSSYVDTNGTGTATQYQCALTPAQLQAAFTHVCDPDGTCHYDLQRPIVIDTQTMTSNGMSLAQKLAVGNFNFRHVDVALNVVGTGVVNCTSSGSPDCFGTGVVQYTLDHDARNVGVLGFDKQYRFFDFGEASIQHANALASERYITTPLASSDQALLSQLMAVQFRGRPLDGSYSLKIYDDPALRFTQIQDIQVILNYHFWSSVNTSSNASQ